MSSEMDYIRTLVSVQTYLYQIGGVILMVVGASGCILSLVIFSKKNLRKNPCSFYFIAYNLANLFLICISLLQGMLAYGYNTNLSVANTSVCRLDYYLGYILDTLSPFYLIMASIDRILVTSRDAHIRRRSTHRLAYICIIGGTICFMLIHSHTLVFMKVMEIMPNYYICYSDSKVYLTFTNYYGLVKTLFFPILMLICEVCTIKNIRSAHRARVAPVSTTASSVVTPARAKDRQLVKILLINVTVYITFNLMPVTVALYQQITYYKIKGLAQARMESFLTSISYFVYYIPMSISCYTNSAVSKTFRAEIKNLLLCK